MSGEGITLYGNDEDAEARVGVDVNVNDTEVELSVAQFGVSINTSLIVLMEPEKVLELTLMMNRAAGRAMVARNAARNQREAG